ncbi:transmembrane protein 51a isoform X2 [Betta splendens]|nr:transmembrane protein 51a isoform X2 [Betta splendens]
MRSSLDGPPSPCGLDPSPGRSNANNSNNGGESGDNSGCQYALCALGVGLVALGIVMVVWSVVPANVAQNSSSGGGGGGVVEGDGKKSRVSSVAFVLVGCGVLMLLLSLGLGLRIKQQRLRGARGRGGEAGRAPEEGETAEERAQRYAVPSYEEAVGSGQYPVLQSSHRPSSSQLPSYDDLLKVDGVDYEREAPDAARQAPAANHRPGKSPRKLLPINIRRIKSEKFHPKSNENSQPAAGLSVEPLTPPPQYEDKVPPLHEQDNPV